MALKYSKAEVDLLNARNPMDYINMSLKIKIPSGRKAAITRIWLEKKGYTPDDIKHARNRHPYWKSKKMEGTKERNEARSKEHDYSKGKKVHWDEKLIKQFISLNKKDKLGEYIKRDWELAKQFKCTIAAIQHVRRKANMAAKITGKSTNDKNLYAYLKLSENALRKMKKKSR